jgi:hypothetical protein
MAKSSAVEIILVKPKQLEDLRDGLRDSAKITEKGMAEQLDAYGQVFVQSAQRHAPRDKGFFAGGLDYKVTKKGARTGELRIVYNAPGNRPKELLDWIVFGTGIYGPRKTPIRPRRASHLVFRTKDGAWHRKKTVKGMKPRNFLLQAWRDTADYRTVIARKVGGLIVDSLKGGRGSGRIIP